MTVTNCDIGILCRLNGSILEHSNLGQFPHVSHAQYMHSPFIALCIDLVSTCRIIEFYFSDDVSDSKSCVDNTSNAHAAIGLKSFHVGPTI